MLKKSWLTAFVTIIVIILIIICIEGYFHYRDLHPKTEDATLDAEYVQVSSLVNGTVEKVAVTESDAAKKGQLLFSLDPTPYQLEYDGAKAKLDMIQAKLQGANADILAAQSAMNKAAIELKFTQLKVQKTLALVASDDVAKIDGEQAKADLNAAEQAYESAQHQLNAAKYKASYDSKEKPELQAAQAELAGAEYKLKHTKYYAPIDGIVTNIKLYQGDLVAAGHPLFVVINPKNYWVVANYSEKKLSRIKIGQPASVTLDMYSGITFQGKVIAINYSSGSSFSLLPSQNASGNWVKTSQRFQVKIALTQINPEKYPLRVGASCETVIDTAGQ